MPPDEASGVSTQSLIIISMKQLTIIPIMYMAVDEATKARLH